MVEPDIKFKVNKKVLIDAIKNSNRCYGMICLSCGMSLRTLKLILKGETEKVSIASIYWLCRTLKIKFEDVVTIL